MHTDIIIMGAAGRMGKVLTELVQADETLRLVAVIERPSTPPIAGLPETCVQGSDAAVILQQCPKAVVIDFTAPEASLHTARLAAKSGNPLVIGTTGFSEAQKRELADIAKVVPVFMSPNMSVGVNVLLQLLPALTRMLGDAYDVEMVEIHHNRKKDAPSGTALGLAECLAEAKGWNLPDVACCHREGIIGERPKVQIGVQSVRGGDVVGVHTVYFMGPGERIEVTHQAHSRATFAQGALRAAAWLVRQKAAKVYAMSDIFAV
ncbi:MAG: 4-hydroxy-tetrahydrodipicolinate reductase [Desulfovibrionaceae bacterium]